MSAARDLVDVVLACRKPMALHELRAAIRQACGTCHETTALSARIRSGAKDYAASTGYVIKSARAHNSAKHLYWLEKA